MGNILFPFYSYLHTHKTIECHALQKSLIPFFENIGFCEKSSKVMDWNLLFHHVLWLLTRFAIFFHKNTKLFHSIFYQKYVYTPERIFIKWVMCAKSQLKMKYSGHSNKEHWNCCEAKYSNVLSWSDLAFVLCCIMFQTGGKKS